MTEQRNVLVSFQQLQPVFISFFFKLHTHLRASSLLLIYTSEAILMRLEALEEIANFIARLSFWTCFGNRVLGLRSGRKWYMGSWVLFGVGKKSETEVREKCWTGRLGTTCVVFYLCRFLLFFFFYYFEDYFVDYFVDFILKSDNFTIFYRFRN